MTTSRTPDHVEWPTLAVAAAIIGGFAAILLVQDHLPTAAVIVALAVLGAWYTSLQHEVIHGHPTPWRNVNALLAALPLDLVTRIADYRDQHLLHHRTEDLTDADLDPESFYVSPQTWHRAGPLRRAGILAMRTLAGRLVLGPFVAAWRHWRRGIASMRSPAGVARVVGHIGAATLVVLVVRASGLSVWVYVAGVCWAGGGLSLLRSFAEHRLPERGSRSAVVRAGTFFSLLFLNNNLHHTHHARPGVPWYELPRVHDAIDGASAAAAGAGLYRGYWEVAWRFLVRPFDVPVAGVAGVAELPPTSPTAVVWAAPTVATLRAAGMEHAG
ncbi:MAG: fatty acid desaturase [Acidimicrobiia bacterium]|nr:fatty acid desaturase [Acidimicrobiia bacterium]